MTDKKGKKSWSDEGDENTGTDEVSAPSVPTVDTTSVETAPAPVKAKDLTVTTPEEAKAAGTVTTGLADKWLCVAKAVNEAEGWMKSTKAMQVGAGGCLIQVTTQQRNADGSWAIAEAVCFAHGVSLVEVDGQGRFLT